MRLYPPQIKIMGLHKREGRERPRVKERADTEPVDLEKLGEDFADLIKGGKFAEMLILAKQVNLPARDLEEALDAAAGQFNKLLYYGENEWMPAGAQRMEPYERAIQGGLVGGAAGAFAGGPAGAASGLALGVLTGLGIGAYERHVVDKNAGEYLGRLEEAREWIQQQNQSEH